MTNPLVSGHPTLGTWTSEQGLLVTRLAPHFDHVIGIDTGAGMRAIATARAATLTNVTITDVPLAALTHPAELITMVAVLHHLPLEDALASVRDTLAPGGRFLAVGLAPPVTARDHAWDGASALTNPFRHTITWTHPPR